MAKDREEEKNRNGKLKRKAYEKELHRLQVELCHLQAWVKETGARIILIFEGRDGAGKGGTIRAITERVSPRVFRVVALQHGRMFEKGFILLLRAKAHHMFDSGTVVPAPIENHDLTRRGEVFHVALHVHLGLLAV